MTEPDPSAPGAAAVPEPPRARSLEELAEDPLGVVQEEVEWVATLLDSIIEYLVAYSFQFVGALILLVVGVVVANRVSRFVLALQERREVDVTLRQFVAAVVRTIILVGFVIIALEQLGVSVAPFLAAIGGLALGASFALQLPVSNYGAGLVIILTRPFRVGDTIRVLDQYGLVEDINLAMTHLTNEDGEQIVIPNKHLIGEVLVNSHAHRVVEGVVGISYDDDPEAAIAVVRAVLATDEGVRAPPEAQVGIQAFGESSVEIAYRYWVPTTAFFEVQYRVNLALWRALGEAGVSIPFPQRDVHLISSSTEA